MSVRVRPSANFKRHSIDQFLAIPFETVWAAPAESLDQIRIESRRQDRALRFGRPDRLISGSNFTEKSGRPRIDPCRTKRIDFTDKACGNSHTDDLSDRTDPNGNVGTPQPEPRFEKILVKIGFRSRLA
ncbi:hypothetical protein CH375_04205 [Leptospira ellisii]|uniref:Uncharacterized protein n=1 Tax=Leptospira ellisii TaxID=2023197 RepID=A0A2N0B4J6_9LEPT|nr:hypothetical protein CH379_18470 [Leptospira ellisii]PKA05605.1 hypothetical protein CH375_04205 [Leptospira ellisii]